MATAAHPEVELAELLERQQRLAARLDELGAEERAAHAAAEAARAALIELERQAAAGEKVSAGKRQEAEDALLQERSRAMAPWPERRAALQAAAQDAQAATAAFVGAHLDALLAGLAERGAQNAEVMNTAAAQVVAAHEERQRIEQETFALVGMVRTPRPGDVARSRAELLVAEAQKLLEQGGEQGPAVLVRPDQPRHATAVPA